MAEPRPAAAYPAPPALRPRGVLWLLPLVFAVHDAEELVTAPGWVAAHRADLDAVAAAFPPAARVLGTMATTPEGVAVAIGVVALLFAGVTAGAAWRPRGAWLYAYAALLGGLGLHVFTHLGQALLFGGYVPGLFGAVLAVLPGTCYLYRRLFAAGLLTPRTAAITAAAGLALFVPFALLAHGLGRLVGPA